MRNLFELLSKHFTDTYANSLLGIIQFGCTPPCYQYIFAFSPLMRSPFQDEVDFPIDPEIRASTLHTWQLVHEQLSARVATALTPANVADLAIYHYCVYLTFGQATDGAVALRLTQRLTTQLGLKPHDQWSNLQFDQACALAWLNARYEAASLAEVCAPASLAVLDQALYQEAQQLLTQPQRRSTLVQIARYLRLRLPALDAERYLKSLLAQWPEVLPTSEAGTTREMFSPPLGLADGLAAELLLLIRIHQAGVPHPTIALRVRQGLVHLLAKKRDVDFSEHKYSVFPYQAQELAQESGFSAEMNWQRGDVSQSLLLYEAQHVLQDAELSHIAELVGLNTLLRTDQQTTGVASSQLYQGAAGLVHLYGKLYVISGQRAYQMGQRYWLTQTRNWLRQELASDFHPPCVDELRSGLVGVGLALLSVIAEKELGWDTFLV